MSQTITYTGPSDVRIVTAATLIALGVNDQTSDLIFNRANSYTQVVPDDVALVLMGNSGFINASGANLTSFYQSVIGAAGPSMNMLPANFPRWRRAMAKVIAAIADARILITGDSTSAGYQNSGMTGPGKGWAAALVNRLVARGIPAALGLFVPPAQQADARWGVPGTGWSLTSYSFPGWWGNGGPRYVAAANATGNLPVTPGVNADTYDIYYLMTSGAVGGYCTATATGGVGVAFVGTGAWGIGKITVSAAAASTANVVTFSGVGASGASIIAIEPRLANTPQVLVGNASVPGSQAIGWANGDAASGIGYSLYNWTPIDAIKKYAPDLTIVSLGINDAEQAAPAATVTACVGAVAKAGKVSGDALIASMFPSVPGENRGIWEPQYVASFLNYCQQNNMGYVDIYNRFGGVNNALANVVLGMYSDANVHPDNYSAIDIGLTFDKALSLVN